MNCYEITTYFDGSHEPNFYILAKDDISLLHALNVVQTSKEVEWYSVDGEDGPEFYDVVFDRVYPGLRLSTQTMNSLAIRENVNKDE